MSGLSKKNLLILCKTIGINIQGIKYKSKDQLRQLIKDYEDTKKTKIIASGKTIKYIYHSADIHIRTLDRHQEYQQVFENLYLKLIEKKDTLHESVFVVCGDIFHNRDRLISETIILFNKFIEKLTSIIDVILIPGNHDIFTHTDRLDTISGIVNIKGYPNFYFLKTSGIYCYHNINFVLSSLVDNKFIRANEVSSNGNIKIALYHGSIAGSKLDNNFSVPDNDTNNSFKIRDFNGYDYVLLGDIHKKQYLTKTMAYPGSLIQQNFKEERFHGIMKWDLTNKSSKFLKIDNDYGYITLYIKNNSFPENIEFPKKSRIKLIHDYTEEIDYEKIKQKISEFTTILSISKEINSSNIEVKNETQQENYSKENLDKQLFTKLTSKYNKETQEELMLLHLEFLKSYELSNNVTDNSSWYIKSLEFKNVYIYGNDNINKINFEDKKGVIGILQNNASGKSSIMNVILYTLFGNITKTKSLLNRNIINKEKNEYYIKMIVVMENKEYLIYRRGKNKSRKNKSKAMEETVEFFCQNENLTDTNKVVTQEKIKQTFVLSDKDLFILTNVMNYSNYISLLNMTSSEIGNIFSKLFNLEHYKEIYSLVLKECKNINDNLKFLKGQSISLNELLKDIATIEELTEIQNELAIYEKELSLLDAKLNKAIKQENSIICEKNINCNENKEDLIQELKTIQEYSVTDYSINEIKRNIDILEKQKLNTQGIVLNTEQTLSELQNELNNIKFYKVSRPCTVAEFNKAKIFAKSFLDLLPSSSDFYYEEDNQGNFFINKEQIEKFKSMVNLFNDTEMLKKYIDTLALIQEYSYFIKVSQDNEDLQISHDEISKKINYKINEKITILKNNLKFLEITDKIKQIEIFELNQEKLKNKKEFQLQIKDLEQSKTKVKNEINTLLKEEAQVNLLLKQQENSTEKIKELDIQIKELEKKEDLYKNYKSIINDRSLPKLILKNTIKQVEKEANKMIYSLAGLLVFISNEDLEEDTKWEVLIKKNGMVLGSEQVSGYERFIINIGLKMALDKYKYYSGSSLFFIDEAFDCISEENIDKIDELFDYLKTYYRNILIISHNEELKKKIDYRINISTDFVSSQIDN